MTEAEKAVRAERIKSRFPFTNDEWAERHCPWLRIACCQMEVTDVEIDDLMRDALEHGEAVQLRNGWLDTKRELSEQVKLLGDALTRTDETLARLGFSADELPAGPMQ